MEGGGQFGGTPTSAPPRTLILHSPGQGRKLSFCTFSMPSAGKSPIRNRTVPREGFIGGGGFDVRSLTPSSLRPPPLSIGMERGIALFLQ